MYATNFREILLLLLTVSIDVGYFIHKSNKRKFFDKIAAENGFDPTQIANWRKFGESEIMLHQVFNLFSLFYCG